MFEPLNNGHAISEVSFFFEFADMNDADVKSMMSVYPSVRDLLPANRPANGMMFTASPDGSFSMNQAVGAEWLKFKVDGNPSVIARISLNSVSISFTSYDGWKKTWETAYQLFNHIITKGLNRKIPIRTIGLRYVDQFDYKGEMKEYSPYLLFREGTPHAASQVMGGDVRWHNYTGWYTKSDELRHEVLQQLNLDSIIMMDGNIPVVTIGHTSLLRGQDPKDLEGFLDFSDVNKGMLGQFMNLARNNNHILLKELLCEHILATIGLDK